MLRLIIARKIKAAVIRHVAIIVECWIKLISFQICLVNFSELALAKHLSNLVFIKGVISMLSGDSNFWTAFTSLEFHINFKL